VSPAPPQCDTPAAALRSKLKQVPQPLQDEEEEDVFAEDPGRSSPSGAKARAPDSPSCKSESKGFEVHLGSTQLVISLDLDILGPLGFLQELIAAPMLLDAGLSKLLRVQCNGMHVQHRGPPDREAASGFASGGSTRDCEAVHQDFMLPKVSDRSHVELAVAPDSRSSSKLGPEVFFIGEDPPVEQLAGEGSDQSLASSDCLLQSPQVVALYDFDPSAIEWPFEQDPLPLVAGQVVQILDDDSSAEFEWASGHLAESPGSVGYFPRNYTGTAEEYRRILEKLEKKKQAGRSGGMHAGDDRSQHNASGYSSSHTKSFETSSRVPSKRKGPPPMLNLSSSTPAAALDCPESRTEGPSAAFSDSSPDSRVVCTPPMAAQPPNGDLYGGADPYDVEMPNVVGRSDLAFCGSKSICFLAAGNGSTSAQTLKTFSVECLHRAELPRFEESLPSTVLLPTDVRPQSSDCRPPLPVTPPRLSPKRSVSSATLSACARSIAFGTKARRR